MQILSIDPGGTTGLALFTDGLITTDTLKIAHVMLEINTGAYREADIFLVERFSTGGIISRYGIETVDLVGQIKGWCLAKEKVCLLHAPQYRRGMQDKAELMLGQSRHMVHEEDALAHLLVYLEQEKILYRLK